MIVFAPFCEEPGPTIANPLPSVARAISIEGIARGEYIVGALL
jgi:hypothetical protein